MAKKLKYPYEQWKDAQREEEEASSPQPPTSPHHHMGSDNEEDEEIDLVGLPADEQTPKPEGQAPINLAGKWCSMFKYSLCVMSRLKLLTGHILFSSA